LKDGFLIDGLSIVVLLNSLMFEYLQRNQVVSLCLFLFYTQFHYFSKILRESEESLNLNKVALSVLNLCKLIMTLLFVEHNFSCLWYFVADYK
jgi:hypothetical protein